MRSTLIAVAGQVDEHMGIAISGLTADARSLCMYMRTECLQHKYVYESPVPVQRLVIDIADKCQGCTQSASARPYGVGLLVAGMDQTGPHVYYNCPSGNYYEYKAMTIGARSQVKHALTALKETSQNGDINAKNASVAIVGIDHPFTTYDEENVQQFIDLLDKDEISEGATRTETDTAMQE
eukprot:746332-Hanusia_phi.AAC.21